MARRIIVAGNCQIAGIAASLQFLFPQDEIATQPFNPNVFKGNKAAVTKDLAEADIVFGSLPVRSLLESEGRTPRRFVTVPGIYFSAFHPDIVAANAPAAGKRFPYNSAICVWAYARRLAPSDAVRLFNRQTFAALGYFSRWQSSVEVMRGAFQKAGLDFDPFYLGVKREGVFMHTVNHPKVTVLTRLAKTLAIQAGADPSVARKDFHVNDALARVEAWPVYPEVAHELGLPGSDTWFVDRGRVVDGLRNYVEYAFQKYAQAGVRPEDLHMLGANREGYEAVLSAALRSLP